MNLDKKNTDDFIRTKNGDPRKPKRDERPADYSSKKKHISTKAIDESAKSVKKRTNLDWLQAKFQAKMPEILNAPGNDTSKGSDPT